MPSLGGSEEPVGSGPGDRLVGELRFDGGSLALNLIATVGRRFGTPVERLTDPGRLDAWLGGVGLRVGPGSANENDLARVVEFREKLNDVVRSTFVGHTPPSAALTAINQAAAVPAELGPAPVGVELVLPPGAGLADALTSLAARDAILLLSGPARLQIAECAAPDCRMLFVRASERRRAWCSSAHCGNRSRVAAHHARRAKAPANGDGHDS
jgi:predicted RNA-binding Zn ribbon-like protein